METPQPEIPNPPSPNAPPSIAGSSATTEPVPGAGDDSPRYQCPWCGFAGASKRALTLHVHHKHPEHREARAPDRKAPVRQPPPPAATEPDLPVAIDVGALKVETAKNIAGIGQLLEGVLVMAKARKIEHPESRFPVRDTHLAHAIQFRAELAADVWIKHAQGNEVLMRALQGFNRACKGGEEVTLVGSLGLAAMATFGRPGPQYLNQMFIPDVQLKVELEDRELRAKYAAWLAQQNGQPQQEAA